MQTDGQTRLPVHAMLLRRERAPGQSHECKALSDLQLLTTDAHRAGCLADARIAREQEF